MSLFCILWLQCCFEHTFSFLLSVAKILSPPIYSEKKSASIGYVLTFCSKSAYSFLLAEQCWQVPYLFDDQAVALIRRGCSLESRRNRHRHIYTELRIQGGYDFETTNFGKKKKKTSPYIQINTVWSMLPDLVDWKCSACLNVSIENVFDFWPRS